MNILYIMRYWPVYGGGETITASLANEFVKRNHNVYIAYKYKKISDIMPYQIEKKIHEISLDTTETYTNKDITILHNYIVEKHIDVMINQWGCTKLCFQAKQNTNCKLITCWHLDIIRKEQKPTHGKWKIAYSILGESLFQRIATKRQLDNHKLNYQLSDKYIFLSPSFAKEYMQLSHIEDINHKISAISNPLTYDFQYNPTLYHTKHNEVLFVGRIFEYHKRLSYVLKIWKNIEKDTSLNNWSLKIVGDGPDLNKTKELAQSLSLQRVSFEGFQNPQKYYNQASIFMMTSAFEGFGMTLVEAQQYATVPIVMDTYKSLHDIITNSENGVIIEDNDIDGYTKELIRLMKNDEYRKRLAFNGINSCKIFSIHSIANKWEKLFNELCKQ